MGKENINKRLEKNKLKTGSYAGGSFCNMCGEYSIGYSFSCGVNKNGKITESISKPDIEIINDICNLCIEDLKEG